MDLAIIEEGDGVPQIFLAAFDEGDDLGGGIMLIGWGSTFYVFQMSIADPGQYSFIPVDNKGYEYEQNSNREDIGFNGNLH
jgi:hypothetical protein